MATEVSICNLALSNLGDAQTVNSIDPPDGSAEASKCAQFYPIARDAILEDHEWSFTIRHQSLASLGSPPADWRYRYALPAGCIEMLRVAPPDSHEAKDFIVEGDDAEGFVILTNVEQAVARYRVRVTDTTLFPAKFTQALSWLLASYLAVPVTQDPQLRQGAYEAYVTILADARAQDANQGRLKDRRDEYEPPHLEARK